QSTRINAVAAAFQHAWDGYSKYCLGHDTLHPVTNTCEDDFGGYGATAIDSLPTAIIFENQNVTIQILEFVAALDFKVVRGGSRIQVFEVTIRHFAAMISAWDLLNGPFHHMVDRFDLMQALYAQMITLGDALSCAFDSPSGVPREWVDPALCQSDKGTQNTIAGAGTMILEFARLSDITGNQKYVNLARKAEGYLLKPQPASGEPYPGLLGSFVNVDNGQIIGSQGSWGALADSFYEYLLKAYLYNSELYGLYLERWLIAADSTIRSIGSHPHGHSEWTLLPSWNGLTLQNSMESLSWFAGGNFILGGMVTNNQTLVDYGLSIADAAGAIYNSTQTGLGGEFVTWNTDCEASENDSCDFETSIRISDGRFRLRPEVLETWYYAYRATKDRKYRDWSWAAFEAINRYCRTESGFSSLTNVDAAEGGSKGDVQESFVFAEVMKDEPTSAKHDPDYKHLPGANETLVIMRTGSTELQDKLPIHLATTLLRYPDSIIFSDFEEDFENHHIVDALENVSSHLKETSPDFDLWRRLKQYGRTILRVEELSGKSIWVDHGAGKANNPGWKLDKFKFLPMVNGTLHEYPDKKWYIFVEPDTFIFWQNMLVYLSNLDWTKPYYLGGQMQIGDVLFGQGGHEFIVSRPALQNVVTHYQAHQKEYEDFTDGHWAGDCVLGKAFKDSGTPLIWTWPIMQGDDVGN
ncbi:alpha-1,2-mannosidase, partial [Aureobasidium melanogenum]